MTTGIRKIEGITDLIVPPDTCNQIFVYEDEKSDKDNTEISPDHLEKQETMQSKIECHHHIDGKCEQIQIHYEGSNQSSR